MWSLGFCNTIYDVFGCDAPVILGGQLLQSKALPTKDAINEGKAQKIGWDDPLNPEYLAEWTGRRLVWKSSTSLKFNIRMHLKVLVP